MVVMGLPAVLDSKAASAGITVNSQVLRLFRQPLCHKDYVF